MIVSAKAPETAANDANAAAIDTRSPRPSAQRHMETPYPLPGYPNLFPVRVACHQVVRGVTSRVLRLGVQIETSRQAQGARFGVAALLAMTLVVVGAVLRASATPAAPS